jgi:hypothetical protein
MTRFALGLLVLALMPSQGISQSPDLYVEHMERANPQPKWVRLSGKPIRVPGNARIELSIALDAGNLSGRIEQLEIKAENQHPGYQQRNRDQSHPHRFPFATEV